MPDENNSSSKIAIKEAHGEFFGSPLPFSTDSIANKIDWL
jgi:hypothetical protein